MGMNHFITHKSMKMNSTNLHQIKIQILNFYAHEAERGKDPKESSILRSYSNGKLESSSRPSLHHCKNQTFLKNYSSTNACENKVAKLARIRSPTLSNLK